MKLYEKFEDYYLKQKEEISSKYNPDNNYVYKFTEDANNNNIPIMELYDEDSNLILRAEYEYIGIFNIFNSVWYWAWAIEFINHKLTNESKKVKKYAKTMLQDMKQTDPIEDEYYYFIAKTSNFYTSSDNINKIIKFMLYVTKGLWYITICAGKDNVTRTCTYTNAKAKKDNTIKRIEYILIKKIVYF